MASAVDTLTQDSLNGASVDPVSFYDYYNAYGKDHAITKWMDADPYSLAGKLQNFFKGTRNSAQQAYDLYLQKFNQMREDNQFERSFNELKKLGLNPGTLLGFGGSSMPMLGSSATYARETPKEATANKSVANLIKIIGLLMLMA